MSPYTLDLENNQFTNMQSAFTFGQRQDLVSMYKFNVKNNSFSNTVNFYNINGCDSQQYTGHNKYLTFLDNNFNDIKISASDEPCLNSKVNLKNCKYNTVTITSSSGATAEMNASYYADINVVDNMGNPVSGANISITNNVNSSIVPMNLLTKLDWDLIETGNRYWERRYLKGDTLRSITTGANGHTPLPSDLENTVLLSGFWKDAASQRQMSYTITASKDGYTNSVVVSPDSTWYRTDPLVPVNTITIQLPIIVAPLAIDINQDGVVDILDLRLVALHFGETTTSPYPRYDVNADGLVDILDIRLVAGGDVRSVKRKVRKTLVR